MKSNICVKYYINLIIITINIYFSFFFCIVLVIIFHVNSVQTNRARSQAPKFLFHYTQTLLSKLIKLSHSPACIILFTDVTGWTLLSVAALNYSENYSFYLKGKENTIKPVHK